MPDSDSVYIATAVALILIAYVVMHWVAKSETTNIMFNLVMFVPIIIAVPILWLAFPHWENTTAPWGTYYTWAALWIGVPVSVLTVPLASAMYAFSRSVSAQYDRRLWPYLIEILVAVPLWYICWSFFEIAIGWVRIFI